MSTNCNINILDFYHPMVMNVLTELQFNVVILPNLFNFGSESESVKKY